MDLLGHLVSSQLGKVFTDSASPLMKPIFNYVCFENNNILKLESEGIINHDHFRGPGVDLDRDVRTYIHTYIHMFM